MQSRALIASALIAPAFAIGMTAFAFALQPSLTQDEKDGIMERCLKNGGTLKACCAAVNGTYKPGVGCSYKGDLTMGTGVPASGTTIPDTHPVVPLRKSN